MSEIKKMVIGQLIEEVKRQIASAEREQAHTMDESKAHKGAMASRYDTFKEEAQSLTAGYGDQLLKFRQTMITLMRMKDNPPSVSIGGLFALIEIESCDSDHVKARYLLLPAGGGHVCEVAGEKIIALNLEAPRARALMGVSPGDVVDLKTREATRRFRVVSVM